MNNIIATSLLLIVIGGCTKRVYISDKNPPQSSEYTSAFPTRDVSNMLENAKNTMLRIVSTTYYEEYHFKAPYITLADAKTNNLSQIADFKYSSELSTSGSSIVLQQNKKHALLITCNHVVTAPDTAISYFEDDDIPNQKYIKSIKIKQKQHDLGFASQQTRYFKKIAHSVSKDLALLSIPKKDNTSFEKSSLSFSVGNSDDLKLGSFIYVLGFPRNYPMVTRGLANPYTKTKDSFFVSDAVFNPGISGGMVLGSKDNFRNLEWVGMARSTDITEEEVLVPMPDSTKEYETEPYRKIPFVKNKQRISYGISQSIPINTVANFINNHQNEINSNGFDYQIKRK